MEKDEPREMELEQELESLYHKVASLAPVEDKQEQDKESSGAYCHSWYKEMDS